MDAPRCARFVCVVAALLVAVSAQNLEEAAKRFRAAKSDAARIVALDAIAATAASGADASDVDASDVARALGRGLGAKSDAVRVRAIELLGGMCAGCSVALDALHKHCSVIVRRSREQLAEAQTVLKRLRFPQLDEVKSQAEYLKKMDAALKRSEELQRLVSYEDPTVAVMIAALRAIPEDRATAGLTELLPVVAGSNGEALVAELMARRSAVVLDGLCSRTALHDDRVKQQQKAVKKLKRKKPGRPPRAWRGQKDAWEASERKKLAGQVRKAEELLKKVEAQRKSTFDKIREYARRHGLADVPSRDNTAQFRVWQRKAGKSLSVEK